MQPWHLRPRARIRGPQWLCWNQQALLSSLRPSGTCQHCIGPDLPGPEVSGYHSFSLNISILPQPASFAKMATRAKSPNQRTPVGVLATASPLVFVTTLWYLPALHWARLSRAVSLRLSLIFLKYLYFSVASLICNRGSKGPEPASDDPSGRVGNSKSSSLRYAPLVHASTALDQICQSRKS